MNREEAKNILRLYRPGTTDAEDPEIAAALALAREDAELARWLEKHGGRQQEVRERIRSIAAPAGLLEQIVAEHHARTKIIFSRRPVLLLAAAAMVAILVGLPFWLHPRLEDFAGFAIYKDQMASVALRGYGMDVITNDPAQIRSYLARNQAPADYVLPPSLQQAAVAGCAIENWQGIKISMVCFRTGQPLVNGAQNDMWLFVVNQASIAGSPAGPGPQFDRISRLATVVWHQDGKLYLLGTTAGESVLRKFL